MESVAFNGDYSYDFSVLPNNFFGQYLLSEDEITNSKIPNGYNMSLSFLNRMSDSFVMLDLSYNHSKYNLEPRFYVDSFLYLGMRVSDYNFIEKTKIGSYCRLMLDLGYSVGQIIYSLVKIKARSLCDRICFHGDFIEDLFDSVKNIKEFSQYYVTHYYKVAQSGELIHLIDNVV